MKRREFLATSAMLAALGPSLARAAFEPRPGAWRTFALTTRVEIPREGGQVAAVGQPVQAWLPLPSIREADWSEPKGDDWSGNYASAEVETDPHGVRMLHVIWAPETEHPSVEVVSRVRSRDRGGKGEGGTLSAEERAHYLAATALLPTDGIVAETAARITAGATTDEARARAIYDWIVENTRRVAEVRGCGIGDVASMLTTGNLGGKCADLNALQVALSRAAGVPARDLYGIRVAPSAFGYKSLGANSETVTKAQHCRAEVWLEGRGWVPVDPADVRKVILEEPPGNNAMSDAKVADARAGLFGSWEGNWIAFNDGHDIRLTGSDQEVAFLMYPQAEVAGVLLDCLAPDTFAYTITAREIVA